MKMRKQLLISSLALILATASGCSVIFDDSSEASSKAVSHSGAVSLSEKYTGYGFKALQTVEEQRLYEAIDSVVYKDESEEFTTDNLDNENKAGEVLELYKDDHPDVFWIDETEPYYYSNDGGKLTLQLTFKLSGEKLAQAKAKLDEKVSAALQEAPNEASSYEKELYAHDYIIKNCAYDEESVELHKSDTVRANEQNAYGALVEGKAVCEGYTRAFQLLCDKLGVDCWVIQGQAQGFEGEDNTNHIWNCVQLDGKWYQVDITWDDPLSNGKDRPNLVNHNYFLLSDEMIQDSNHNHYGYTYTNPSDDAFDVKQTLHSINHPFFAVDGKLYTLYRSGSEGRIATYDYEDDELTDVYTITDKWYTSSGAYWSSNFSDIGIYQGLLYFNRENSVDIYDPATGKTETYIPNALGDGRKLFGMYVRDGVIYGLAANSPNDDAQQVELGHCKEVKPQDIPGDVNLDGVLDISDATMIQSFLAELTDLNTKQLALADFNNDGDVNINDATDIQFAISR